jgi:hypothetical protein
MDGSDSPEWAAADTQAEEDEESVSFTQSIAPIGIDGSSGTAQIAPSPDRVFAHRIYRGFKFIAIAMALLLGVAQIVSVVFLPFDGLELVLKIFLSSFSVLVVLNEAECWGMLRGSPLFWNWISRGYFYAFIGLVSLEENNINPAQSLSALPVDYSAALFIETASWSICAVGVLYFGFGLCCGQRYLGYARDDYLHRKKERKRIFEEGLRSDSFAKEMLT